MVEALNRCIYENVVSATVVIFFTSRLPVINNLGFLSLKTHDVHIVNMFYQYTSRVRAHALCTSSLYFCFHFRTF